MSLLQELMRTCLQKPMARIWIGSKSRYTKISWGASTGSVSISVEASGDETIWLGRRDVAGTSKDTSTIADCVRRRELAQSAMYSRCNHNRLNFRLKWKEGKGLERSRMRLRMFEDQFLCGLGSKFGLESNMDSLLNQTHYGVNASKQGWKPYMQVSTEASTCRRQITQDIKLIDLLRTVELFLLPDTRPIEVVFIGWMTGTSR